MTNWLRCTIARRRFDAPGRLLERLERFGGKAAPRITKVLGVVVMLAGLKLGVLAFIGLDMLLPDPPATAPQAPAVVRYAIPGPGQALAQQAQPAPQGQAAQAQPGKGAPAAAAAPTPSVPDAAALLKRQDELDQRERALKSLETDLNARVAKLKEMEGNIKSMIDAAKGIKDEKVKHLVDVYSNMNAKQAAKVLETLDNGLAVKILAGMRGRQAGEVLNNMEAKKAAELTEMLTKLQLPPQDDLGPQ